MFRVVPEIALVFGLLVVMTDPGVARGEWNRRAEIQSRKLNRDNAGGFGPSKMFSILSYTRRRIDSTPITDPQFFAALYKTDSADQLAGMTAEFDLFFWPMEECRVNNLACRMECQLRQWRTGFYSEILHCLCVA